MKDYIPQISIVVLLALFVAIVVFVTSVQKKAEQGTGETSRLYVHTIDGGQRAGTMIHEDAQQLIAAIHSLKTMMLPFGCFIASLSAVIFVTGQLICSAIRERNGVKKEVE